jgi:hypothetical protein
LNGKGRRGDKGRDKRGDRSFICLNKRSHFLTLNPNQQAITLFAASKIKSVRAISIQTKKKAITLLYSWNYPDSLGSALATA